MVRSKRPERFYCFQIFVLLLLSFAEFGILAITKRLLVIHYVICGQPRVSSKNEADCSFGG